MVVLSCGNRQISGDNEGSDAGELQGRGGAGVVFQSCGGYFFLMFCSINSA